MKEYLRRFKLKQQITAFDIIVFLRQLATLLTAGVPIIQSCDMLANSQEKSALRLLIHAIKRDISAGKQLAQSLQAHPHCFDNLTCQLIKIGEHTGRLDTALETVAAYQEKNWAFKNRLQQALFYPCVISITALAVTVCMLVFVIPRFADLFQATHTTLPLVTMWVFWLAHTLKQHGLLLGSTTLLALMLLIRAMRMPSWRQCQQKLLTTLPLIRSCWQKIILARFARHLALTYTAGIPINDALTLTAQIAGHAEFAANVAKLSSKVRSGLQLHQAMLALPAFPALMIQMVKIGEESGMLAQMLHKVADFFESDVDLLLAKFCQLLEPLILLVQGVLIGGLVLAMYLPIFKLGSVF